MKKIAFVLVVFCLSLAVTGCRKKQLEPGVIVADKQVALAEMKPEDVIVSVNGKALTRKAYDEKIDLLATLYSIKKPSAAQSSVDN